MEQISDRNDTFLSRSTLTATWIPYKSFKWRQVVMIVMKAEDHTMIGENDETRVVKIHWK